MINDSEYPKWERITEKIIVLNAILQPLLDVLTSVGVKLDFTVTAGVLARAALVVYLSVYELFLYKGRYRKHVHICLGLLALYLVAFAALSYAHGGISCAVGNLVESVKLVFFALITSALVLSYLEDRIVISDNELNWIAVGYAAIILIAYLTGTSNVSYNREVFGDYTFGYGYNGWFSAANETSNVINCTAPILIGISLNKIFNLEMEKGWRKAIPFFYLGVTVFAACMIGTKLGYVMVFVCIALCTGWGAIVGLVKKNRKYFRIAAVGFLCCASMLAVYKYTPMAAIIEDQFVPLEDKNSEQYATAMSLFDEVKIREGAESDPRFEGKTDWLYEMTDEDPVLSKLNWVMSRRISRVAIVIQEYIEGDAAVKLLGVGYRTNESNYFRIDQPIEMDALSVLVRHGIIGFALLVLPCIAAFVYAIVLFFRNIKEIMSNLMLCVRLYSVLIMFIISNIAGHVITAPSISFCVAAVYLLMLYKMKHYSEEKEEYI